MPPGALPGERRGGRQKGTPNRATVTLREKLAAMGCDPIEAMAKIVLDAKAPLDLRGRMAAELAQYIEPKRKAIEHSLEPGTAAAMAFVMFGQPETRDLVTWEDDQKCLPAPPTVPA